MSRAFKWPLLLVLVVSGLAFAFDYRFDASGGPEALGERIAAALERWRAVEGSEVTANESEIAPNIIRYGDGPSFGPDTFSLTVQRLPEAITEVLLDPNEPSDRALTHELGLIAGLNAAPLTGDVMDPAIPQEATAELTPGDVAALRALQTFVPEDVNQDGAVDFYDLAELGAAFGETGVSLPQDIDQNGIVSRADFERLRAAYTFGAPAETDQGLPGSPSGDALSGGAGSGGVMSGGAVSGGALSGGAASGGAF